MTNAGESGISWSEPGSGEASASTEGAGDETSGDGPAAAIELSDDERGTLQRWVRRHSSSQALALPCRIVLAVADGGTNVEIAERLGINWTTVGKRRHRSAVDRLEGGMS